MRKKRFFLILSVLIIALFIASCKQSGEVTNPNSGIGNNNQNGPGNNNGGSGGDNNSGNGGDNNVGNGGNGGNGGDNNGGNGGNGGNTGVGPQYPGDKGPNGLNSAGEPLGELYTVVTPKIYMDNTWGEEWKVRRRDFDRMNMIWGQILKTYKGDSQGLGLVFGPGVGNGIPGHPDLKNANSYTKRLYHKAVINDNWDFFQPFDKYSTDNSPQVPNNAQVKRFKYAVLVYVEDDAHWKNRAWKGKYTIGAVYEAKSKNKYAAEQENQVQYAGYDEIMIVRSDCILQVDRNGVDFDQVQLLFSHHQQSLSHDKIYKFSDFGNFATGPERSIYLAAIPYRYAQDNPTRH